MATQSDTESGQRRASDMSQGDNEKLGDKPKSVFLAPDCPVEKVTVYPDRAEVCRRVETTLATGLNQVVISKLPDMIDSGSIRVEGKGAATISEVVFDSEHVPSGEGDMSEQLKQLTEERKELNGQKKLLESELSVLTKQWALLESFATTASKGGMASKDGVASGNMELKEPFFTGLTDFLQLYSKEGNALMLKQLELQNQVQAVQEKISALDANYNKLTNEKNRSSEVKKCTIVTECKESCKVLFLVSYVTSKAAWTPSYDIRMFSAENQLKITYFGQICQLTGEDWVDAKLYLSTAMPSIGGEVPELPTAELRLYKPQPLRSYAKKGANFGFAGFGRSSRRSANFSRGDDYRDMEDMDLYSESVALASPQHMEYAQAEVGEGVATTMYEIARRSTIPSDNVQHKVTVGLIDIKPTINHTSIPQKVPQAFMLAKVTNSSPYTFLAGETSIFLDNSFVGKASLKDVYPMEEFDCSLGVDPAVKITYKPQKKYRASSGLLTKVTSNTHEQVIEVKNTHDYGITIKVVDQLPRSSDERIKVQLLEPQIDVKHPEKSRDKDVVLNNSNNLEWTLEMKPQEVREMLLKYTVEYPAAFKLQTGQ